MADPHPPNPGSTPGSKPSAAAVLVLVAHPSMEHSRVNRSLMQAAASVNPASGIEVRDLYALYPDYVIDTAAERRAAAGASLIVWLHPTHWYGMPPLMKLWCDEVLGYGWAYGHDGHALHGKDLWLVTTTGGPEASYHAKGSNRYAFDAFLPPYDQTAALCGMRFLPPMLVHGAHRLTPAEIQTTCDLFANRLQTWPEWPELASLKLCETAEVEADERPVESSV
jgi:glutathione-regulated potassium-efflux system ancillary protein KefF